MAKLESDARTPVTIYSTAGTKARFQRAAAEFSQQSDPFLNVLLEVWDSLDFERKARAVSASANAEAPDHASTAA